MSSGVLVVLNGRGSDVYRVPAVVTGRHRSMLAKYVSTITGMYTHLDRYVEWTLIEVHIEGEARPRYVCSSRVEGALPWQS